MFASCCHIFIHIPHSHVRREHTEHILVMPLPIQEGHIIISLSAYLPPSSEAQITQHQTIA
jgi:hypothetical protein